MKNAKRLALALMVVAMAAGTAQAQMRFGIKAGANFNKLHLDNAADNFTSDNGCGFTGGVMGEFHIPIVGLGFDVSLMYTRMNGDVQGRHDAVNDMTSDAKNFFEIPINLKYKLGLPGVSSIVSPYIFTGPDFAFKLGGKDDVFETKTYQAAWNVGLGLELVKHLQIQGSYGFGMNNVSKYVIGGETSSDIKAKNNYWTVTAAWLF